MDSSEILTRAEVQKVLSDLRRRAKRSVNTLQNLIIFRLSAGCGLRASEISGLNVGDLCLTGPRPRIRIRKEIAKRRKARMVPLWWDAGTLADLKAWRDYRVETMGAQPDSPFICNLGRVVTTNGFGPMRTSGARLGRRRLFSRWRTAIKVLGEERHKQVPLHGGRHTFISHAIMVGRSLGEVQSAAGHSSLAMTTIYTHLIDREGVPDLFDFRDGHQDARKLEAALMVYDVTLKCVLSMRGQHDEFGDLLASQIKAAKDAYLEATGEKSMVEFPVPEFTERRNERRPVR